jgi:hypothetical protein
VSQHPLFISGSPPPPPRYLTDVMILLISPPPPFFSDTCFILCSSCLLLIRFSETWLKLRKRVLKRIRAVAVVWVKFVRLVVALLARWLGGRTRATSCQSCGGKRIYLNSASVFVVCCTMLSIPRHKDCFECIHIF